MKEIGMLFSSEMVRAILGERKTQTRRLARDCRIDEWNGSGAMMSVMNNHLQFICFVAGIAGIILMFVLGDDD